MADVLVTGGAGFIGSHLVRQLLERADRVRVLDNLSSGRRENLEGLDVELIVGDIRDLAKVQQAAQGAEIVFHLAAMISVTESMADPLLCYETNVLGSVHVLRAGREAGARRIVLSSSCAVYGEASTAVSEDSPTRPLSPYAATKLAMEEAGRMFGTAFGLPAVSLRYFNVYGPRQSPDSPYAAAIPIFIRCLLDHQAATIHGDGLQTRDFVYVDDVVRANLLAAERSQAVGRLVNVGGGRSISVLEMVEELRRLIPGSPAPVFGPPRPGDIRFSSANIDLAASVLGYRAGVSLAQGLQATVEWSRQRSAQTPT